MAWDQQGKLNSHGVFLYKTFDIQGMYCILSSKFKYYPVNKCDSEQS